MDWERRVRILLPVTCLATFSLILLGIYTAAVGAGLTCGARWPLCDGAVFGLFPANWPSFVEWIHRLVAMVTGLLILTSWWASRRTGPRRAAGALAVAVVLLPVQIWLGAETVFRYELLVLTAHFLAAIVIFGSVATATWWSTDRRLGRADRSHLGAFAVGLLAPFLALTPHALLVHTGAVQVAYYGIGLVLFCSLLVLGLDGAPGRETPLGWLPWIGVALVAVRLLAGRLVRSPAVHAADLAAAILLVVLVVALWLADRSPGGSLSAPIRH